MATPEVLEKLTKTQEDIEAIRTELAELDSRLGSVEDAIGALILPRPPLYYSSPKKKVKCKTCGYEYTTPPDFCPRCLTKAPTKSLSPQVRRLGVPRTDVERVMAHYGVSRETAEKMIEEVGAKTLLPPRGLRVRIPEGYEELSPSPNPSRWVLEMYPLDVLAWRRSLIELAGKPLTPSEARLVHSYDDYLSRKGYLTSRQIEVLGEIARRHEVDLPALPEVVVR